MTTTTAAELQLDEHFEPALTLTYDGTSWSGTFAVVLSCLLTDLASDNDPAGTQLRIFLDADVRHEPYVGVMTHFTSEDTSVDLLTGDGPVTVDLADIVEIQA